jgi:ankyrin repeat protein
MMQFLLNQNADPNFTCPHQKITPLIEAVKNNSLEILITHGADVNLPDNDGQTPLHYATKNAIECNYSAEKIMDTLLRQHSVLLLPSKKGETPVLLAAKNDHLICSKNYFYPHPQTFHPNPQKMKKMR